MKYIYNFLAACCLLLIYSTSVSAQQKNDNTPDESVQINGDSLVVVTQTAEVDYGFLKKTKQEAVSAYSIVKPGERIIYDNTEGAMSQMDVLLGLTSGRNIRGIGNALYVIDGIPGRDLNLVNANEIEQITVLKDANAVALYGSQGRNGVIIVTTKRGKIHKNVVNVNASYGIKSPISYPDYLGSADYMDLYNEARFNDGLDFSYDSASIANTRSGMNPYRYPDVDFYTDEFLKPLVNKGNIIAEFMGGTDKLQYYVNVDYGYTGTLEKINPDVNKGSKNYKVRGNLDFTINNWIKSTVDIMASLGSQKSAPASLLSASSSFRPNLYAPLLPVSMISNDEEIQKQLNTMNVFDGYILGGSSSYKGNIPFAQIYAGGYNTIMDRTTQVGNTLDFDLSKITEGLSAKTYISLDYYSKFNISVSNKFNFYEPTWSNDTIIALAALGDNDQKDQTESISTTGFMLRTGFYGQLNYDKQINKDHFINATALAYSGSYKTDNSKQTDKVSHLAFSLDYNFRNKYFANFSSAYSSSIKLPEGNRGKLSPSVGLSYILSEENFFKKVKAVDYLKLRASWGNLKTDEDIDQYFLYQEVYNLGDGSFNWDDGTMSTQRTTISNGRNDGLTYIEKEDINVGFEAILFKSLYLDMNYFRTDIGGFASQDISKYPSFYNTFIPYQNNEKNRYNGVEVGANFEKDLGDFKLNVGGTFIYSVTEVMEAIELPQEYDYLSVIGQSLGRINGLTADGLYGTADFDENGALVEGLPAPQFGTVHPGDIKYVDINDDKVIDNLDKKTIGHNAFPYSFGLNVLLQYKGFSLFVLGKGQNGAEAMKNGSYYWVNGNDKYPSHVTGRWTEQNAANATYPRLTTGAGSNNFQNSTFWMYDKSYFDIRRAQLTYEFNNNTCKKLGINNLSINIAGENLFKFSPNQDILELNTSGSPKYRNVTLGLRVSL